MKRSLLLLLILLGLGAMLGLWLLHAPGYVLLSWRLASIETSLWVAGLAWFASLVVAVAVIDLLVALLGANTLWGRWTQSRHLERSARLFHEGTVALEQGDWRRAERQLFSAARLSTQPLPAYIAAARAAAAGQDFERAEQYLVLAEERGNKLAVGLARARLLLAAGRWEQAAALLLRLSDKYRKDEQVLKLRVEALTRLQKWGELAEILPGLQKRLGDDDVHYEALELRAHREVMAWIALSGSRADRAFALRKLHKYWESLSRRLRADADLLVAYAAELAILGADDEAEALLADLLSRSWSNAAVEAYGRTRSTRPDQALTRALGWKEAHPHNPALMLALGRLSLQNRRWQEAREYFEAALGLRQSPEAQAELLRLLSRLDPPAAERLLTENVSLPNRLPDLPLP